MNPTGVCRPPISIFCISAAILVLSLSTPANAQCPWICGDFNCTGSVTYSDIFEITRWLYQLVYPCLDSACWNLDGHDVVTVRDVVYLTRSVWPPGLTIQCDSSGPELPIPPTTEFFVLHEKVYPAGDSVVTLHMDLVHWAPIAGFSVAYQIRVGAALAESISPDGFKVYPPGFIGKGLLHIDPDQTSAGLFGFSTSASTLPPGRRPMLKPIAVLMSPAPVDRIITVELVNMDSIFVNPTVHRNSMVVDGNYDVWEFNIGPPACPFRTPGDADMSGFLNSTDIIIMVNYVFKGGAPADPCPPAGDANCDLSVTSADVIFLVNHVFKGGPAPPCDLCTIYAEPWDCY